MLLNGEVLIIVLGDQLVNGEGREVSDILWFKHVDGWFYLLRERSLGKTYGMSSS